MQNGHTDPGVLLERLRTEVRKRKLALELETPEPAAPELAMPAAVTHPSEEIALPPPLHPTAPILENPRLKKAQAAVGRAFIKNESARGWPRFLRGIRRNQEAINDSLILGVRALLETVEWTRSRFTLFETEERGRSQEQQGRLLQIDQRIQEGTRHANDQDSRIARHENQLTELYAAIGRQADEHRELTKQQQHHLGALYQKLDEHQRQALAHEERGRECQERLAGSVRTVQEAQESESRRREDMERQVSALFEWLCEQNIRLDELLERNKDYRNEIGELTSRLIDYRDKSDDRLKGIGGKHEEQAQKLADVERFIIAQQKQTAEEQRQAEEQQRRIQELSLRLVGYQEESRNRLQLVNEEQERQGPQLTDLQKFVNEQQEQTAKEERQLADIQKFISEQQEQTAKEERQLAEIQKFVSEQQKQTKEAHRQFEEHQKQLSQVREDLQQQVIDLNYKLINYQSEIGVRFQHTADLRQHEQLAQEIRTFIDAQEAQTQEEQRQIAEQQKQFSELNTKLVEYQYHAGARYRLATEQQEQEKRQLTEVQNFIKAQEEHNADKNRQLQEQQESITKLALEFAEREQGSGVRLEQVDEKQQQHERQLADMQKFVSEQQKQTEEEHRQLAEQRNELADITARLTRFGARQEETGVRLDQVDEKQLQPERQFADMEKFVSEQQKQTEEEHLQLAQQRKELADVSARLTRFAGRQDETGIRLEQIDGKHQQQERQLTDMQKFVSEQQVQTEEEHRQLIEQGKQLAGVNAQLIEYQNDACARYHLTAEQQEQEKRQLEEMQGFIRAQEKQTIEEQRQLQEVQAQLTDIRARLEEFRVSARADNEIGSVRDKVNALQGSFAILQTHLAKRKSRPLPEPAAHSLSEDLKQHETDAFYLAFENQFRGDREEIKQRLRFYLPVIEQTKAITGDASAVDVGCGRGEWLELLQEHGYEGRGVDLNICMVEECRSRGLKAECADAIAYLRELPSGSLSLITGFHIVEHLAFNQLFDLFRESLRVLRVRGVAIFETPNPECAKVPAYSFYLDPTHRNPIPHELLCFAARQAGFGATRVERLQAYFEEGVFKGHLDYAGIFTK